MPIVRGTRAGLIVLVGVAILNLANAAFHLITARVLGPGEYSELVSLLTLAGLISLPVGGAQIVLARYVSEAAAASSAEEVSDLAHRAFTVTCRVGIALTAVAVLLSGVLRELLDIASLAPVVLIALFTLPALLAPVLWGFAQGLQRFTVLAVSTAIGSVVRVAIVLALVPLGLGVTGATAATLVSGLASLLVPLPLFLHWLRRPRSQVRTIPRTDVLAYLGPVVAGTLAITSLTTIDLLVAKIALSPESAGVYGGASFVGRLLLYLPMTIATVLLPKVVSRAALAQDTKEILHASLAVTAAFSLLGTALLVALPQLIVGVAFGGEYEGAVPLIGMFGLAMTGFALLNVLFVYHLGHGRRRIAALLLAGACCQVAAYALVHGSTYQLVTVNLASAVVLLIVHELWFGRTLVPAVRWLGAQVARRMRPARARVG